MAIGALPRGAGAAFVRGRHAVERWLDAERDQLVLWLPVALGCGIAAWLAIDSVAGWAGFTAVMLGIGIGAAALGRGGRAAWSVSVFALAAAFGCLLIWWRADAVAAPVLARPAIVSFAGEVEAVERLPARDSVRVTLAPIAAPGLPPRVRVSIASADVPGGLAPGARAALKVRLVPPPPAALPGAYDFARVAWFRGLGATGKALGRVQLVAPAEGGGFAAWLADTRARLSTHIAGRIAGSAGGIAASLVTGDQGAIAEPDAEAMRRSGLAHLLSISGLHITAAVAAAMWIVLRLLALSPWLALRWPLPLIAAGAGALAGIGYTLLAGAEVPTIRSCVAALLVLSGMAMGRDAVTLRLVATGALLVLLLWPESLAGPSFQLSFAAVTAIVALHEHPAMRRLALYEAGAAGRTLRGLFVLLVTGVAVEVALAPIALFHFHRQGLYGALANIVAIPLTTFVVMPLEALALLLDGVGGGEPFWWLAAQALALLLWIARTAANAPGAVAALPSMPVGAFALMIGGGVWLCLWRTRVRRLGLAPLAAGALWAILTPAPDLLVTGDGRHVGVRAEDGSVALLRPRAGDYVRSLLAESAGFDGEAGEIDALPGARCGRGLCAVTLRRGGRDWRVLATRSSYLVDIAAMNRACAAADIVISERRLPRTCTPRWLKLDRPALARSGGVAIGLAGGTVRQVRSGGGAHPWVEGARGRPTVQPERTPSDAKGSRTPPAVG